MAAAPNPLRDPQKLIQNLGVHPDVGMPEGNQQTGMELSWKAFVAQAVADDGKLRLWTCW